MARVLIIEPFYGGSHKQLLDTITSNENVLKKTSRCLPSLIKNGIGGQEQVPCISLMLSQLITLLSTIFFTILSREDGLCPVFARILFSSSVLNLAELIALRPDLSACTKILYFHENQLVYPVQKQQERDFQYGYNQILSCLVADKVMFNSLFNLTSFLDSIGSFFKLQPDHRPKDLSAKIRPKATVLYFPVSVPQDLSTSRQFGESTVLHIVWPHRWEHDKDPETFFHVIETLIDQNCNFQLSVLGEQYQEIPAVFTEFRPKLEAYPGCTVLDWGYVAKKRFYEVMSTAHVVVSTALHEFYGVSMIEAAQLGCWPLCPARLSYPEIFPKECLYNTRNQLAKMLRNFCRAPSRLSKNNALDLSRFTWNSLKSQYVAIFS